MFPTVYIPDGYTDVLKTSHIKSASGIHGPNILGFISPFCVEVDSIEDFERLAFQIQRNGSPLLDWLKSNFSL
jgi:hypothetical protein